MPDKRITRKCNGHVKGHIIFYKSEAQGFLKHGPRLSYTECIELLKKGNYDIQWGDDFGSPEETYISAQYKKPVIVYGFPSKIKAFYMKRDPENEKVVLGMDILAPEGFGEIIGGSEREVDIKVLLDRIKEEGLNLKTFHSILSQQYILKFY